MKYLLRLLLVAFFTLSALAGMAYFILDENKPEGTEGTEADMLAKQVLKAINHEDWEKTRYVEWTLFGHEYFWDKKRNLVKVEWKNWKVILDLNYGYDYPKGKVWKADKEQKDNIKQLKKAWKFFANDSFWLSAPFKLFDKGTKRSIVENKKGQKGLMITYMNGGVTPGDSYLWLLDENNIPYSFKMWVSIIPIGGLKASWNRWTTLSTGAKVATKHSILAIPFKVKGLKAGLTVDELGYEKDPFSTIAVDNINE